MGTLTATKRSASPLRPFSRDAEDRTDALIQAIDTIRAESYGAHCSHLPALSHTLLFLAERLGEAIKAENPHTLRSVSFDSAPTVGAVEFTIPPASADFEAISRHDQEPDLWHAQFCTDSPCPFCTFGAPGVEQAD